ncbi:MAG: mechanosensitive ion channel family protein [Myxococcaceae bacterium]|nr:mechanosensitive ion channel family protein [Myxococcaceae bacterium]
MLALLESNLSLVAGVLLVVLVASIRVAAADALFRRDLGGALMLLVAHLALRGLDWALPPATPATLSKVVTVGWMLALAWGAIRAGVALGLKVARMRRREAPKILRDVLNVALYALSAIPVLKSELDFDLTGILATSAVLSLVLGLALQETLGNLFAGLSLQLEEPFEVGDWVTIGAHTGRVVQVAWRATRIETQTGKLVTLPNNMVAKEAVQNFTGGELPFGVELPLGLSYEAPPNLVKRALAEALKEVEGVLPIPAPVVRVAAYEESSVRYLLRFFVSSAVGPEQARDELLTRLWYRLKRDGIEIPVPQRAVHVRVPQGPELGEDEITALLREVDLFAPFDEDSLLQLRAGVKVRHFGQGERILEDGAEGHTFYVVVRGEVSVRAAGSSTEVSRLERGAYFGEMSLLTGEPRAATVVASSDAVLLEVDRALFADLFRTHPELARLLSAILAERRSQLRAAANAGGSGPDSSPEANRIFSRLRQIFRLRE